MAKPNLRPFRGDRSESTNWEYRAAFERASVATFLFDASNRLCLDANKAAETLTGLDRSELLDRRIEDFHLRESRARAIERFEKFLSERGFSYDDLPIETEDEGSVPVEVRGQVIGFDERKAVLVYFRDLRQSGTDVHRDAGRTDYPRGP